MRYFASFILLVSALVGLASAATTDKANPVYNPVAGTVITAGQPYTVSWSPTAGKTVNLILRKGSNQDNLDILEIIATNLPNTGAFLWVPSTEYKGDTDYSIQITSETPDTSNYSARFTIKSNGKGIPPQTTLLPSTTRPVAHTAIKTGSSIPTYTGNAAAPSESDKETTARLDAASAAVAKGMVGLVSVLGAVVVSALGARMF